MDTESKIGRKEEKSTMPKVRQEEKKKSSIAKLMAGGRYEYIR